MQKLTHRNEAKNGHLPGSESAACVTLSNAWVTRALGSDPAKPGRSRKIFWLSFKNDEKTQIFRIFTNNFFFRDFFSSCFHWSMTHVWMTGCEAKAFLNKPDWIQPNLIWKLERRSSLSLELITKRRKLKKGGKEGKKERKKGKTILVLGPSKVRPHSEPSEREARTTCERPLGKNFVTQAKTQLPTLILAHFRADFDIFEFRFYGL